MDQYNYQNTGMISPSHKSELIQLITFISFAVYCVTIFKGYAVDGNRWWWMIPSIVFMIASSGYNIIVSKTLSSVVLFIVITILSIVLYGSAKYIQNNKDKGDVTEEVGILEKKYLISIVVFIGIAILTASPVADWIAGSTQGAMYSKTFIFIFSIICFTIYILVDSIRNYNLFDLKSILFGSEDKKANDGLGTIIITGLWMFYSLIVFEGIQFVGGNSVSDTRHYITIAIMTLLWVILAFISFINTNEDCEKWSHVNNKNNYKEIMINIISFTSILFILTIIYNVKSSLL